MQKITDFLLALIGFILDVVLHIPASRFPIRMKQAIIRTQFPEKKTVELDHNPYVVMEETEKILTLCPVFLYDTPIRGFHFRYVEKTDPNLVFLT